MNWVALVQRTLFECCNAYSSQMPGDPRDHKRSFQNAANSENDPADRVFEDWIKLREAQGWTREAAFAELMIARGALLAAIEADKSGSKRK
jgi:hypothetical protein